MNTELLKAELRKLEQQMEHHKAEEKLLRKQALYLKRLLESTKQEAVLAP